MNKVKHMRISALLFTALLFFLVACGSQSETTASIELDAMATGPFFSGPNSLIAEYDVDLSSIVGLEDVSQEQIESVKITALKVILDDADEMDFTSFSSATIQMVSSDADMQTIGIKNPIDSQNQELLLQLSEEADLADYLKGKSFSLVLDLDFTEDSFAEELGAKVVMEINVKHN